MNPMNRLAQLASRVEDDDDHSRPPPGWPFNLPSRRNLDYLEQALTEDTPTPDWYGSDVVILDDQDRYVWSWSVDTPIGRSAIASSVCEFRDYTTGGGALMFGHTLQQQREAAARGRSFRYSRSRAFAPAFPQSDSAAARATLATQPGLNASSESQPGVGANGGLPPGHSRVLARPVPPIVFQLPRDQPTIDPRNLALELRPTDPPNPSYPWTASGVVERLSTDQQARNEWRPIENRYLQSAQSQDRAAARERAHTGTRQGSQVPHHGIPLALRVAAAPTMPPESDSDYDLEQSDMEEPQPATGRRARGNTRRGRGGSQNSHAVHSQATFSASTGAPEPEITQNMEQGTEATQLAGGRSRPTHSDRGQRGSRRGRRPTVRKQAATEEGNAK